MTYAIHNDYGENLGFLLLAGEGDKGDCIFRSLPSNSKLFDTPISEILFQYQEEGEFQWHRDGDLIEIENPTTASRARIENGILTIHDFKLRATRIVVF